MFSLNARLLEKLLRSIQDALAVASAMKQRKAPTAGRTVPWRVTTAALELAQRVVECLAASFEPTKYQDRNQQRPCTIMKGIMAVPSQTGFDETALVIQAREGDSHAFAELVKRYEAKISRLAQHITQNREDTEDVLQEAFLKGYEYLDQFQGKSKFYTWIVRIALNQALMTLRRRKANRSVSLDEDMDTGEDVVTRVMAASGEDPEQRFSREEFGEILNASVEGLAPVYRSVFVLRDVEDLSTKETAKALGISVPAVNSRLLRARLQLRERLTRAGVSHHSV